RKKLWPSRSCRTMRLTHVQWPEPTPDMPTQERTATAVRLLHTLFEHQTGRTPHAIALELPPGRNGEPRRALSYAQLEARADGIAGRLAAWVDRESVVAVLLPRDGFELWAAQLGILKAGAAWTCIEPGTPEERLRFLLEASHAVAVVAADEQRAALRAAGYPEARIVSPFALPGDRSVPPPRPAWVGPNTLAYVIYTSGTT